MSFCSRLSPLMMVPVIFLAMISSSPARAGDGREDCALLNNQKFFPKSPEKVVPEILRKAGKEILDLREKKDFEIEKKSNFADLKTKGDCTSQSQVFGALKKAYPQHRLMGEEKCQGDAGVPDNVNSPVLWILDPIDGTTNYAHGLNHFNISLALVVNDTICYGAVYAPVYDELFYARKGAGAYLKDRRGVRQIHVSQVDRFDSSLWVTGFKAGDKKKVDRNIPIMREIILETHDARRPGSAALDLAYVAAGRIEGYWELFMDWWDIAAGLLLVEEAGGKTFVIPQPANPKKETEKFSVATLAVMASNGQKNVHDTMRNILEMHLLKKK